MDLQFSLEPLQILKWIGLVLAAGFIGYFGRHLSMLTIERLRRKKAETPAVRPEAASAPDVTGASTPSANSGADKDKLKLEKKRAKLEEKRAKKAGE
ncbi:hypothetical protein ACFLYX_01895 [Chloroflexota bacterium]